MAGLQDGRIAEGRGQKVREAFPSCNPAIRQSCNSSDLLMRPFTSTISLDEARRRLTAAVRPIERTERVHLERAAGRVAATAVSSPLDVPPFARAAMDGYAVVAADTARADSAAAPHLRIVDRVFTGQTPRTAIQRGLCTEIATGAPLPDGADAVVMVEDTSPVADDVVAINAPAAPGQHVGRRGADIATGTVVVSRGDVLTPGRLGALAAIGCEEVEVYEQPRVAILSTGNEVVEPGHPLAPGQIYDVNRFTLSAVVGAHGGVAEPHHVVKDTIEALLEALDGCRGCDLLVFSGGSSVGERDLILDAVSRRGEMIFHGISIKPGKPTAFAIISDTPLFGMPGNPTSCLSNAYVLLVPFLRALARLPRFQPRVVRVPLGRRIESPASRHQIYTVRIIDEVAHPAFKGSGDITSLSNADGYIEIPGGQHVVEEGSPVEVTLF
jgi:molybdopterin molybdotransferase